MLTSVHGAELNPPKSRIFETWNFVFGQAGKDSPGPSESIGVVFVEFQVSGEKLWSTEVGVCFLT